MVDIKNWIRDQLKAGYTPKAIKKSLAKAGHDPNLVDEVLAEAPKSPTAEETQRKKKPSRLWYLLPIFLTIIGGVIGYFLLKDRDRKFAERLLIVGLVMLVVWFVLDFLFTGLAYLFISGVFTAKTASIIGFVDGTCSDGVITFTVRNDGTKDLSSSSLECTPISESCSGTCNPVDIKAGHIGEITISGCSPGHTYSYKLSGPSNTISMFVFCS